MSKVVVTGGSGFIGQQICREALARGHEVVSVSRSGCPAELRSAAWAEGVTWHAGDVLWPERWRGVLAGADALIHCVGIISEQPKQGVTFERLNGDSAIVAAREAERAGVGTLLFLSAAFAPPLTSSRYLANKRRAEQDLLQRDLRTVVFRPGLVYGAGNPAASLWASLILAFQALPAVPRYLSPLEHTTIARAALNAVDTPETAGIYGVDAIRRLANARTASEHSEPR
ncbi:MAG: NAD(P)H-binding protein [Trueperaceae bacterium]|nr:NAD(P)H-binding protein [Trueperaceae bacterium]